MDKKNRNRRFHPFKSDEFQEALRKYPRVAFKTPDYTLIRATAIDIGLAWEEKTPGGVPVAIFAPDTRMPLGNSVERGPWQDMHRKVLHAVDICEQCKFDLGALLRPSPWGEGEISIDLRDLATHPSSQGRLAQRVASVLLSPPTEVGEELTGPEQRYQQAAFDLLWGLSVEGWGTQANYLRRPGLIKGATIGVGKSEHVQLVDEGVLVRYRKPESSEAIYVSSLRIVFSVDRRLLPNLEALRENLPITGQEELERNWGD